METNFEKPVNRKKAIALLLCAVCFLLFAVSLFMRLSYFQEAKKQGNGGLAPWATNGAAKL